MPNPRLLLPATKRTGVVIGLALWLTAVAVGIGAMVRYELEPGAQAGQPRHWPADASISLDNSKPNFVLFAHPRCPCTKATFAQLQQIAFRCQDRLKVHVFFYHPAGEPVFWTQTPLWQAASAIPGVAVHADPDGVIAKQFGAETSGQTLLFDPRGELLFSGGITGARGHEGDNFGQSQVLAMVFGGSSDRANSSVFGCSLLEAQANP